MSKGTQHDFSIFCDQVAPYDCSSLSVWVDLGFLGISKKIQAQSILIPHKKPKNAFLEKSKKEENTNMSKVRVVVENSIAMIKRYFILHIKNRMHLKEKLDNAVELAANLWNFKRKIITY